jgi:hypothetical protein
MTECSKNGDQNQAPQQLLFPFFQPLRLTLDFNGGETSSDAGFLLLRQQDERSGLLVAVAAVIPDRRQAGKVEHDLLTLLRQRVYQIAAGYEDANDADDLRRDPLLKAAAADRAPSAPDLASQPTLSRFENSLDEYDLERIMAAFVDHYLHRRCAPPDYLILDLDGTDDPCHGAQQMALFHGYYDEKIYHDLVVFDGETGELIAPLLRPGNVHGADGVVETLDWLLPRIRHAWPETAIIVRADGGMAVPRLYEFLEQNRIDYVIGLVTNPRLRQANAAAMKAARQRAEIAGQTVQVLAEFDYAAESWTRTRRVIAKAELLEKGENQRFVVTSLTAPCPTAVYDFYKQRGEAAENRIKEWKTMMAADRLSCHRFWANWFRLLLHSLAYELVRELRAHLAGTELERATVNTIRLKLLKVGARVRQTARRLWVHLAGAYPYRRLWIHLHARLCAG